MIVGFLISIAYSFLSFLLGFLPSYSLPAGWVSGVFTLWSDVNAFSFVVPVATLLLCLTIAIFFHVTILAWRFIGWVIRKIPGLH